MTLSLLCPEPDIPTRWFAVGLAIMGLVTSGLAIMGLAIMGLVIMGLVSIVLAIMGLVSRGSCVRSVASDVRCLADAEEDGWRADLAAVKRVRASMGF